MDSVRERFWSKVKRGAANDCWPWTAHSHQRGYGVFWHEGRNVRAHRLALEWESGPAPFEGAMALHSCDNPPCCNPSHLRWGTAQHNKDDQLLRKGPIAGEASPVATITNEIVATIYRRRLDGFAIDEIADELSIPYTTVENVYTGHSWAHRLGVDGNPTLDQLRASTLNRKQTAANRVVTDEMVDEIYRLRMDGKSTAEIAAAMNLPKGTVSPVSCGIAFAHRLGVDGNPTLDQLRSVRSVHPGVKLTDDDVSEIRDLLDQGYWGTDIAAKYGVSRATISNIKSGKR